MRLRWAAAYADGREVTGQLPQEQPGAAVPRYGLRRFTLLQGTPDVGWSTVLTVELADHERLVFRRRVVTPAFSVAAASLKTLIVGVHDTQSNVTALNYLNGDGTITMRVATGDVAPEPHEVG